MPDRRPFPCSLVGTVLLYAVSLASLTLAAEGPKTNVLFIICDDLNCDLACYAHPQVRSPHIDRLARSGLRFENAYCQFPLCGPSRASFMTGLYPDQTTIRQNGVPLRDRLPEVPTMSQLFRKHGYTATRVGKIYHYNVPAAIGTDGHDDPLSWDRTINPIGRDKTDEAKVFTLRPNQYGGTLSWLAADGGPEEQTDGVGAAAAVKLLERHAEDKTPFFLAVGFYRPHTPYVSPKKCFEMYPADTIRVPTVPADYLPTLPPPARRSIRARPEQIDLDDDLAREAIRAYYASITFVDEQVGHVLAALERLRLDERTIVVFTSDHGYHMGEHGHWQKRSLFDNAARVPLIIRAPGMKTAGLATDAPAEMIDFYPTLADLCQLPAPENLSGVSLRQLLFSDQARPRADALTQLDSGYSLRTPRYRYTEWGREGQAGRELYDHRSDPAEMVNLGERPEHATVVSELSRTLRRRIAQAQRVPPGLKPKHAGARLPAQPLRQPRRKGPKLAEG